MTQDNRSLYLNLSTIPSDITASEPPPTAEYRPLELMTPPTATTNILHKLASWIFPGSALTRLTVPKKKPADFYTKVKVKSPRGSADTIEVPAWVYEGSSKNLISHELATRLGLPLSLTNSTTMIITNGGNRYQTTAYGRLEINAAGIQTTVDANIVPDNRIPLLLGSDWINHISLLDLHGKYYLLNPYGSLSLPTVERLPDGHKNQQSSMIRSDQVPVPRRAPTKNDQITRAEVIAILKTSMKTKNGKLFRQPVVELWKYCTDEYEERIIFPMDLRTMKENIQRGLYSSVEDVRSDLHLLYTNAEQFNGPNHYVTKAAAVVRNGILKKLQGKRLLADVRGSERMLRKRRGRKRIASQGKIIAHVPSSPIVIDDD